MNRILEIPSEKLSSEQSKVFDQLTAGRGRILGPYKIWIHSPTVASGMERIGAFLNKFSSLSKREGEIGILVIAQHWQGGYVRQAHIREGNAAGTPRSPTCTTFPETMAKKSSVAIFSRPNSSCASRSCPQWYWHAPQVTAGRPCPKGVRRRFR